LAVRGRENQIGQRVMDALNDIEKRHEDDNVHPLDLKKQKHQEVAKKRDKAMIWAAATGHFDTEIIRSPQFQRAVSLALKATNRDFDVAPLFRSFSNFSVKLQWLDYTKIGSGIERECLLTFKDLTDIKGYANELNHCDDLWKFIFYDQHHLFWSMAMYYALIGTTGVDKWDAMFKKHYALIRRNGKRRYIDEDMQ